MTGFHRNNGNIGRLLTSIQVGFFITRRPVFNRGHYILRFFDRIDCRFHSDLLAASGVSRSRIS